MKTYNEFQFATVLFIVVVPVHMLSTVMFLTQAGTHPMSLAPFAISNVTFLIVYLLFYGMRTSIEHGIIRVSYGIGVIQKKIKLADIQTVSIVSNPWYYGWGIRFIPNGMLYNISGSAGIELVLSNTSRIIRIGSADAASLKNAIRSLRNHD